jgi:fusion and transport protein UGO1
MNPSIKRDIWPKVSPLSCCIYPINPLPIAASPKYVLKTDVSPSGSSGVWGMMRRIRRTPSEGLPALWKGQLISTIHSLLSNNIQPIVHTFLLISLPPAVARVELNAELDLPLTSHPHPALPLGLQVASHLVTHLFLSPLELIRTRLIVQPSSLPESKSSLSLLRDAVNRGGGFTGLYLHSHLIIPAILEHTLRPLLTLSIPLLIERQLNITPDISPVTYSMLDLGLGLASLLIILPIETVRKRMQLQDRAFISEEEAEKPRERKSIVRLRQRQYHGIVEAIWRIITEETTAPPRKKRRSSRGVVVPAGEGVKGGRFDGVRQLYRGVSLPCF